MPLLSLQNAATRLGVSAETLRKWAASGRVPCVRLGRRLLFDEHELQAWVARHSRPELNREAS